MKIILGSKSPRRQQLIHELGFEVEVRIKEVDEIYPDDLEIFKVPEFLAKLKSEPLTPSLQPGELLVTSDTVVLFDYKILGKPKDEEDAFQMIRKLSENKHTVISGVCLTTKEKQISFSTETDVFFSELTDEEICYYIERFKPFDKAGSYGIQEWIGYIGIDHIHGCYYNVMGLPLHDLYQTIKKEFSEFLTALRSE